MKAPQTLCVALSQVLNSLEEQTQTHQRIARFFPRMYYGPAILHLGIITLSFLIKLIHKWAVPGSLGPTHSFPTMLGSSVQLVSFLFEYKQHGILLFTITEP